MALYYDTKTELNYCVMCGVESYSTKVSTDGLGIEFALCDDDTVEFDNQYRDTQFTT